MMGRWKGLRVVETPRRHVDLRWRRFVLVRERRPTPRAEPPDDRRAGTQCRGLSTEECESLRREGDPRDRGRAGCPRARIAVADHADGRTSVHAVAHRATEAAALHYVLGHV